jgi:cellulose synthase/poly-beta-1,6-N-acetylglucosamine synthase-like glycosyltransferase
METIAIFLIVYQVLILLYFLFLNTTYTIITIYAFLYIKQSSEATPGLSRLNDLVSLSNLRPISILVPAYNEELNIVNSLRGTLQLQYEEFEVIVINDGSTDDTMKELQHAFDLIQIDRPPKQILDTASVHTVLRSRSDPRLWVLDKDNGGKADALNAGLTYSSYPLFCAIDADSLLESDSLLRMGQQFLIDKELIAAGGAVRVLNGCTVKNSQVVEVRAPKSILSNIQISEYLRGFMAGRVAFGEMESLLIISGAFGIFRKDLVMAISGFRKTVGEDMDLVLRLHRHCVDNKIKYKVRYVPEPVCWTQVPGDLLTLLRQRNRWQRGLVDSIWHNRVMLFNPKFGKAGMIGMPYFFFVELLGPIIEFLGYFGFVLFLLFHLLNPTYAMLFFILSIVWGMWLNAAAVLLDNYTLHKYPRIWDSYKIAILGTLEYFGYRQLVTVERLIGTFQIWRSHWGSHKREAIGEPVNEGAKS